MPRRPLALQNSSWLFFLVFLRSQSIPIGRDNSAEPRVFWKWWNTKETFVGVNFRKFSIFVVILSSLRNNFWAYATLRPSYGANWSPWPVLSESSLQKLGKIGNRLKNLFESPSPPPKSEFFLKKFSEFAQNCSFWSWEVMFDLFT